MKVLGCAHQSLIWTRRRQASQLWSTLREFYPAALDAFDDLASGDALAVLAIAPTPARGRALFRSKIARSLQDWGGSWARGCSRVRGRPDRFHDTKSRKNYAGTSPITRASGRHRVVGILDGCLTHNMHCNTTSTPPGHTEALPPLDALQPWDVQKSPKTRSPVALIAAHSSSVSTPLTSAIARTVSGTR